MNRRRILASVGTLGVAASAGCTGLVEELTTFSASPAEVTAAASEEAGYDHQGTEEWVERREFAGEEVEVTNYASEYTRGLELPGIGDREAAVFATVASPEVSVAGREFNPLAEMDEAEIVEGIQGQYEGLSIGDRVDGRQVESLGTTIDVETFEGTATLAGEFGLDVLVDVSTPDHDGDHLVLVGIHPEEDPAGTGLSVTDERGRITTMLEGLDR